MSDPLGTIKSQISTLDFSMIIKKMTKAQGWKQKHAVMAVQQYKRMLFLWKKYGDHENLPPSEEIDEVWHNHILDTDKYQEDCQVIFGQYLRHYPYFGMDNKSNTQDLNKAFERTRSLYREEFGEDLLNVRIEYKQIIKRILNSLLRRGHQ